MSPEPPLLVSLDPIVSRCPRGQHPPTLSAAAEQYSRQWRELDKPRWENLRAGVPREMQREALSALVSRYRVARNLPRRFDVNRQVPRYAPLLEAVEETRALTAASVDPVVVVPYLAGRISTRYGGAKAVSLASKVGWFAFRSPVVIYDSLARDALGIRGADYPEFYALWRARYRENHDAIAVAAAPYSDADWFRERVFDIFLWMIGDQRRKARARGNRSC